MSSCGRFLTVLVVFVHTFGALDGQFQAWRYKCDEHHRCVRTGLQPTLPPLGLSECKLTCEAHALFWPKLRELDATAKRIVPINADAIEFANRDHFTPPLSEWLGRNIEEQVKWLKAKKLTLVKENASAEKLKINFFIQTSSAEPLMRKNTNESYSLEVDFNEADNVVVANISAGSYFGARHAIETLFQAIEFDDVRNSFIILSGIKIRDYPEFSHRGITFDTSRNFITKDVILKMLDGMAHSKPTRDTEEHHFLFQLNVFHWHIVDTHSFPVELLADPINQMVQYGAYNPQSVYTQKDIKEIVAHANFRGIRVIPELDQPAHTGNGWNFPGAENYTVCFNSEPWLDFCVEPPCGQLNPGEPEIYNVLEKIYKEFFSLFNFDSFHMGADEISFNCWNSSELVTQYMAKQGWGRSEQDFINLWTEFQSKSSQRLKSSAKAVPDLDILVWTSHITQPQYIHNLPKEDYIVQIWTDGNDTADPQIKTLAEQGYRMVFSNVDALYLDCGYGAWIGEGNNWCSPYKGWQKIYSNDLYHLLRVRNVTLTDEVKKLVLGAEAAVWSEQVDSQTLAGKVFPRAAALAERLWSNPSTSWYEAEQRMLHHRERLTQRGVMADALQPEWCRQNGGQCYGPKDGPFAKDV